MSNLEVRLNNLAQLIQQARPDFKKLAKIHGATTFDREASFALQILRNSDYLAEAASANPDSLKYAILNIASSGLTLNPMAPEVYLVPRKVNKIMQVMADISWRGLVNKAVESEAIEWAQAEMVYENDTFAPNAIGERPSHDFKPFEDRGKPVGVYCVAKLPSGSYLKTIMTISEVKEIAEKSEAFKKEVGPWFGTTSEWAEMVKKTCVRRNSKSWPKGKGEALKRALELDKENNGDDETDDALNLVEKSHSLSVLLEALAKTGRSEAQLIDYSSRAFKRKIDALDQLTELEILQVQTFLKSVAAKQVAQ